MSILELADVNRTYLENAENIVEALKDVTLTVKRGEFLTFIGASGCGKTTLLRLIAGLDEPLSGSLLLDGAQIRGTNPNIGYVAQQGALFPWLTVEKNIAFGLSIKNKNNNKNKNKNKIKIKIETQRFINLVGLEGFEKSFPHQISGGMAQRAAIARALINKPKLLLLDEPMGALDSFTRAEIQDALLRLRNERETTTLLVTHDVDEAIYLSDRIAIMTPRPGKIKNLLEVKFPRPRNRGGAEFLSMRRDVLERLQLASAAPEPEYNI